MPYLNLDLTYFNHPKTRRLIGLLGKGSEVLPLKLWAYAGTYHFTDGKLADYSAQAIEDLLGWWGKPGEAVGALVRVKFLDKSDSGYSVHDWVDHQGHIAVLHERAKSAARKRWETYREQCSSNANGNATSNAQALLKQCSTNAPYLTIPSIPSKPCTIPLTVEPLNAGKSQGSSVQGALSERFFSGWDPESEKDFMSLMGEVSEGMENYGGRWRNRWRESKRKCLKVLEIFRDDAKTKVIPHPGGYMNDLWEKRTA